MKSQVLIQQYYEQHYRERPRTGSLQRVHSNLRGIYIQHGARVIDIGCGSGIAGLYLAGQSAIPFGIDLSFEAVRAASSLRGYAAVVQANAECLPFADLSFDDATLMGTLEHFVDPVKALCEANRVLQPGAHMCSVVPNGEFFLFRFLGGTGQPHERPRTYEGWYQLFEAEGLKIEEVYRDVGPGIWEGGLLRGILRKLVLLLFNLLPLHFTYQFVFICRKGK